MRGYKGVRSGVIRAVISGVVRASYKRGFKGVKTGL